MRFRHLCAVIIFSAVLGATIAQASTISFQGTFGADNQSELFKFTASATGAVIETFSYAGGTNGQGTSIPTGGFDPWVALFDPTTTAGLLTAATPLLDQNNDGTGVAADPNTGAALDSLLDTTADSVTLNPGSTYYVVLTQNDNGNGGGTYGTWFTESSPTFSSTFGCSNGQFCDSTFVAPYNNRTGAWALDISGVTSASDISAGVPEPGSLLLFGIAAAGFMAARRRKAAAAR